MRILVLMTTAFGFTGGIPRINRNFVYALTNLTSQSTEMEARVLCMVDRAEAVDPNHIGGQVELECFSGNKMAFVLATLSNAIRWRPDLVLATHVNLAPLAALLRLMQLVARYMVVVYGIEVWGRLPLLRRLALRGADRIISISQYTADQMWLTNGTDQAQVRVLPMCLDPFLRDADIEASHDIFLPALPTGRWILTVSRLDLHDRGKGCEQALQALPDIVQAIPDIRYIVVGDGDLKPSLEQQARGLGIAERVIFVGRISDDRLMRKIYHDSTLFVMPSHKEGFGLVFLEAMYHGLAVVAGNQDATPEVVKDGITGLLVDPMDPEVIAEAVIELLQDDVRRGEMGRRGQELVRDTFTFEHFVADLWDILQEVGGSKRASHPR